MLTDIYVVCFTQMKALFLFHSRREICSTEKLLNHITHSTDTQQLGCTKFTQQKHNTFSVTVRSLFGKHSCMSSIKIWQLPSHLFCMKLWINTKTKCETDVSDISKPEVLNLDW